MNTAAGRRCCGTTVEPQPFYHGPDETVSTAGFPAVEGIALARGFCGPTLALRQSISGLAPESCRARDRFDIEFPGGRLEARREVVPAWYGCGGSGVAVYQGDLVMGVEDHRGRVRWRLGAVDKDA
jgi:hypothetical protein